MGNYPFKGGDRVITKSCSDNLPNNFLNKRGILLESVSTTYSNKSYVRFNSLINNCGRDSKEWHILHEDLMKVSGYGKHKKYQ